MESENYVAESTGHEYLPFPCMELLVYRALLRDICPATVYGHGAFTHSAEVSRV